MLVNLLLNRYLDRASGLSPIHVIIPQSMHARVRIFVALSVVILLIGGAVGAYIIFMKIPTDLATATAEGIKEAFHVTPQVRINQTVIIEQNTPILELATVARQLLVDYSWSHTWMGSTKTIRLQAVFTAKGGVDLREPFRLTILRSPLRVEATLPPAKLLSLTMDSYKVLQDEDGWWNRISNADRDSAMGQLQSIARTQAGSSGLLDEVKSSMRDRIMEIVKRNNAVVEFEPTAGD